MKERISSFESKYGGCLRALDEKLRQLPETFESWDDIVEGKTCADSLIDL